MIIIKYVIVHSKVIWLNLHKKVSLNIIFYILLSYY